MNCGATITITYYYEELLELNLTPRNWSKIKSGKPLRIRGKGFRFEGPFYWDCWSFGGGVDGSLYVGYGNDGGYFFDGCLKDAEIIEHGLDDHPRILRLRDQVNTLPIDDAYKNQLLSAIVTYRDQILERPKLPIDGGWDDLEALQKVTLGDAKGHCLNLIP